MEAEKVVFYQHDQFPYLIVRVTDTFYFEWFDTNKRKWVRDDDMFYRVYEDDDYHTITEEQADEVISKIPAGLGKLSDEEAGAKLSAIFC